MNIVQGKIKPIRKNILVTDMEFGQETTSAGIIIQQLDGKSEGIKPRWGRVWAIGPEVTDIKIGDWVCVAHGRWTRGIKVMDEIAGVITIRKVDDDEILIVADEKPLDVQVGQAI